MKNKLTIRKENITNIKELINDYGYEGLCYYFTLTEIIDSQDNLLPIENLPEISRDTGIDFDILTRFTDDCISKYKMNGQHLIISDGENLSIPSDTKHVNLSEEDYKRICNRLTKKLTDTAISILDEWLDTGTKEAQKHIGKNHKWFFRYDSWVINEAKRQLERGAGGVRDKTKQ